MEELIKLIVDNGISVVCVGFLMYYILVVQRDNRKILEDMSSTLISICAILGVKKEEIELEKLKVKKKKEE